MNATTPQSSKTPRRIRPSSISASPEQRCQMIEQAAYFRAGFRAVTLLLTGCWPRARSMRFCLQQKAMTRQDESIL
jgi:hypothetical protein